MTLEIKHYRAKAHLDHLELQIAEMWKRVLNISEVSSHDNFFNLGGDSLKAMAFSAEFSKRFGADVTLTILINGTLADIALSIASQNKPSLMSRLRMFFTE